MLVPAPYQASEKKAKKKAKGARGALCHKGTSDLTSEDADTHSPPATDDEEEEESDSPPEGERNKMAASTHLEAEGSKKGKASAVDNPAWDVDNSSEWRPRDKPLAKS